MNKIKYFEKKYLCNYDLSLEFFNELGIKVNDIVFFRKVFVIFIDDGNKILKKVNYDIDKVNLISDFLEYIKKIYKNVILYNKFKNNFNYKKWKKDVYVVMDILDGREVFILNLVEVSFCVRNIVLMYKVLKGLREYLSEKYNKDFLDILLKEKF